MAAAVAAAANTIAYLIGTGAGANMAVVTQGTEITVTPAIVLSATILPSPSPAWSRGF
jgi:hypothetical protein